MLVLSRRVNESIVINEEVTVRVLDVGVGHARVEASGGVEVIERRLRTRCDAGPHECSLSLPGGVSVQAIETRRGVVRLGVEAPPNVPIRRDLVSPAVVSLQAAIKDSRSFLTPGQHEHLTGVWMRLGWWGDPEATRDLRIERAHGFWELRVRGSVLGRATVSVYFAWLPESRTIVVLGVARRRWSGPTPRHIVIRIDNRLRAYLDSLPG